MTARAIRHVLCLLAAVVAVAAGGCGMFRASVSSSSSSPLNFGAQLNVPLGGR